MNVRLICVAALMVVLSACSSTPSSRDAGGTEKVVAGKASGRPTYCPDGSPYAAATEDPSTRGNYTAGGLYKPGVKDSTPTYIPKVECIPEPEVRDEPRSAIGNRSPYSVLGKQYKVLERPDGFVEKGTASYYGAKFHGRLTSNREVYDMYAFSAAHKTLPLPSFARVTNLDNGESVIVRVNDRGPFHEGRVIDLSYAAAVRLGITQKGTGNVEVRALTPGKPEKSRYRREVAQTSAVTADPVRVLSETLPAAVLSTAAAAVKTNGVPLLQVASYSSRDNAERALQRLRDGGIDGGWLQEVQQGARTLWRLRVGSADVAGLPGLMQRITSLGFEQPRVVNE